MAVTKTTQATVNGGRTVIYDSDADGTVEFDVMGGATNVATIIVDNSANAAQAEYLKLWDAKAVTIGTTAPDFIFKIPAGQVCFFDFQEETSDGTVSEYVAFQTALSYACVTTAGTAGSTSPTSNVKVWVIIARS